MKAISIILSLMMTIGMTQAGEVTGAGKVAAEVLAAHNMSVQQLKAQGLKVLLGEVTGAGKSINLDRINAVVTKNKVFKMNHASHIEFKHPSAAKALQDVKHLEFNAARVRVNQLNGIVYE